MSASSASKSSVAAMSPVSSLGSETTCMGASYVASSGAPFSSERFTQRFTLANEAATARLGAALGHSIETLTEPILRAGFAIGLSGELGAGKTALVRAVLRRLGVSGPVKSPTFSLLELYSI